MIRFGIIGTNFITERFLDAATHIDEFQLKAVYSRTEERAVEFAEEFGAELTFTNIEEMANCNEIDAIYIASPNSFHAEQAIVCMNGGKHVICEKPMASNTKEVDEMIKSARDNQVLLMEALKTNFLPNIHIVKENLHKIGKVRRCFASYCQYSSRYDAYKQGTILNAFNPKFSNGALMDIGVYCIHPLVLLFGEPKQVKANAIMLESGVDGEGSAILQYEGMEAVILYSKITNSYLPAEIQGEEGNIVLDNIHTPSSVKIHYKDGSVEDISVPQDKNIMYYEIKEFMDCIKEGKKESNINTYNNSYITAKILDEIRKQIGLTFPADKCE